MIKHARKYAAELMGTFFLTLMVALSFLADMPLPGAVIPALTLALFVYTVGPISGSHLNPAVTIGLWSVKKINDMDALKYVIAQFLGAGVALVLLDSLPGAAPSVGASDTLTVAVAELVGAFLFVFGVASVAYGKVHEAASGIVVGWSLLLGIVIASIASNGILNPAVALGVGSFSLMYVVGPVVGGMLGAWTFRWMSSAR